MRNQMQAVQYYTSGDTAIARFITRHPLLSSAALFTALPLGLLAAVGGATTIIILPVSLLFGWL